MQKLSRTKAGAGRLWLIMLAGILSVGFAAISVFYMWVARDRDRIEAIRAADNVVSAINSEVQRNLELYDLSLQAVVDGLALPQLPSLTPELKQLLLFDRAATARGLGSIFVLDVRGNVTIDSRSMSPPRANYASSDFFKVARTLKSTEPFLSRPWRGGAGEWLISISRRINDSHGHFAGLVVGTLKVSYFRDLLARLQLGASDALNLVREDGSLIVRTPGSERLIGRNLSSSSIFQKIQSQPQGNFEANAKIDGIERTYVFQRIGDWPLTAVYAVSTQSMFANWRHQAFTTGIIGALLILANLSLVAFLIFALNAKANAESRLIELASVDPLTGLLNRREFAVRLDCEWERARLAGLPIGLLIIDADHFKLLNDEHGHLEGDRALEMLASLLREATSSCNSVCARYGGEEFAVLLPGSDTGRAQLIAERIRDVVASEVKVEERRGHSLPTVSIGVASAVPNDAIRAQELFEAADAALYLAKARGRNRCDVSDTINRAAA